MRDRKKEIYLCLSLWSYLNLRLAYILPLPVIMSPFNKFLFLPELKLCFSSPAINNILNNTVFLKVILESMLKLHLGLVCVGSRVQSVVAKNRNIIFGTV